MALSADTRLILEQLLGPTLGSTGQSGAGDLAAEIAKAGDLAGKAGDLAAKAGDLAAKAGDLTRVGDLVALAEMMKGAAALHEAMAYADELYQLQGEISGELGARLQRHIQRLQTALSRVEASFTTAAKRAGTGSVSGHDGRDVHIHLHLGV